MGRGPRATEPAPTPAIDQLDPWLEQFYGDRLQAIDAALAGAPPEQPYALFHDLDDDAWALLLTQHYELYPNIRALLPSVPDPSLQELWNGASGVALAIQSKGFYARLRATYARHGAVPLDRASVLDFGCGWGRLTRYLARDVAPGRLYGCDPVEAILDACRADGVPAELAQSAFRPRSVPFDERFDLAFAFSVFTHLSEPAHLSCLAALHDALGPQGILVLTVRPPAYLSVSNALRPRGEGLRSDEPRYLFVPHPPDPRHPQQPKAGELDYGEAVITMPYVRRRWSRQFELLETGIQLEDPYQVVLTLRRR